MHPSGAVIRGVENGRVKRMAWKLWRTGVLVGMLSPYYSGGGEGNKGRSGEWICAVRSMKEFVGFYHVS